MTKLLITAIACSFALSATLAAAAQRSGKEIYTAHCAMCHESGVAGAPKAFDQAAWQEHMSMGMAHMLENAEKGTGAMPPKGMCNDCSEAELKGAIEYMTGKAK